MSILNENTDCQSSMHGHSTEWDYVQPEIQIGAMYAPFHALTNDTQIYTSICVDSRDDLC